ncbi:MAG: hypothetical protein JWO38_3130 [Gemmataceae bacterium]|nr:hypothetical protein [Gemmataceae bacterium]
MATIQDAVQAYEANDFTAARAICEHLGPGNKHARFLLGVMESNGEGGRADPVVAAWHYRAAAEGGHPGARYNLAALFAQGRGVPQDFAAAMHWYSLAAEAGDADALFQIGTMYASGEGVPIDLAEAGDWWEKGVAGGQPQAMQSLGRLYARGHGGRPHDPGLAAYWFFKAWQGGQDDAEQDIIRVRADLEAAAAAGSADAQNALGLLLCFGHDDPATAAGWLDRAAAQDHPEALRMLGCLFDGGKGVPKDDGRATELYRRAAELGDKFGQFNLAVMFNQGRGVPGRDVNGAIAWFRRAARQGIADANRPLAELLAERNRDRRDANEAIRRMVAVAHAGPPDAKYQLAAGDGSWVVTIANRGTAVSMVGLRADELEGLPDEE